MIREIHFQNTISKHYLKTLFQNIISKHYLKIQYRNYIAHIYQIEYISSLISKIDLCRILYSKFLISKHYLNNFEKIISK